MAVLYKRCYALFQNLIRRGMKNMKQADLRSLSRAELLELLIEQGEELERTKEELLEAQRMLQEKKLALSQAGSIAEASLQVSGIFEAAQAASAQYLESIEALEIRQREQTEQAEQLLRQTQAQCAALKAQTQTQCDKMIEKAKKEALSYWTKVSRKLDGIR